MMQIVMFNLKVPGEVHANSASGQWARRYHEVYPGFCCIKQLGVHAFQLISAWASYYRVIPSI